MSANISAALNELVAALTEHAEVMSGQDVPPRRAVDAIERVRAAAARYSDETFEASGWSSPFSDLFEEDMEEDAEGDMEEDTEEDTATGAGPVPESAERISVTGRWDFVVADREAWFAHVTRRLEGLGATDCAVELDSAAQAAHVLLTHDAPFEAYTLHGLLDGDQHWTVEQIPGAPSERPHDEERP
ncbi:hypothetical protein [Streptomyces sudanensis]|uniref:hypothetical protein n=1 Tax=Streptomyces sudanensis TaxID=436397 RepID=UPI0020CDD24C|nr:hypothetical protein [Streptomyces sudanensis]MCQ0002527.1 hypothetical protein [Streptomyces sudanensis]